MANSPINARYHALRSIRSGRSKLAGWSPKHIADLQARGLTARSIIKGLNSFKVSDFMSMQPETRFRCDRCPTEINVVMQNTPSRGLPPEGWLTARFDEDASRPLTHFCPSCAEAL